MAGVREGPYIVAIAKRSTAKYTVSLEDGKSVKNGQEVDGKNLSGTEVARRAGEGACSKTL